MDLVISRSVRLLGLVNVLGMVAAGIISAELKNRFDSIWYLVFAAVCAGLFTLIWTVHDSDMQALTAAEGRKAYSEQSCVGVSVAMLVLITAAGCAAVGLAAAWAGDGSHGRWAFALGGLSSCLLAFYWTWSDYNLICAAKRRLHPEIY